MNDWILNAALNDISIGLVGKAISCLPNTAILFNYEHGYKISDDSHSIKVQLTRIVKSASIVYLEKAHFKVIEGKLTMKVTKFTLKDSLPKFQDNSTDINCDERIIQFIKSRKDFSPTRVQLKDPLHLDSAISSWETSETDSSQSFFTKENELRSSQLDRMNQLPFWEDVNAEDQTPLDLSDEEMFYFKSLEPKEWPIEYHEWLNHTFH
jgi:hypothetical protein